MRVLVVEDEPLLAVDLEMIVEDSGHNIAGEARCLQSALALTDDTHPHLALVDVHLARGTSGLDVSAMIQRRWPDTVIIFITANPKHVPDDLGGAHGIIAKPFSRKGIIDALTFIKECVFDPPPRSPRPSCLAIGPQTITHWMY